MKLCSNYFVITVQVFLQDSRQPSCDHYQTNVVVQFSQGSIDYRSDDVIKTFFAFQDFEYHVSVEHGYKLTKIWLESVA